MALLALIFKRAAFYVVLISAICAFSANQFILFTDNSEIVFLCHENSLGTTNITSNNLRSISNRFTLSNDRNVLAADLSKSIVVPLSTNNQVSENNLRNTKRLASIFMFGEHNNLAGYIGNSSKFNDDSYQRRTPWIAFKPIFRTDLFYASNKDILYSSNLGCTINFSFKDFPIVWDYKNTGEPIILASGTKSESNRLVFFGDSDPIAPFLAPYNAQFLRTLFGVFDYRFVFEVLPILISSLMITILIKRFFCFICIAIVFISLFSNHLPSSATVKSDINILTDMPIYSPHYDSNYSSLPAKLVNNGFSVTINIHNSSDLTIHLINGKRKLQPDCTKRNLFFLFADTELQIDDIQIISQRLPLGSFTDQIQKRLVMVEGCERINNQR